MFSWHQAVLPIFIFDISLSQDREWLSAAAPPVLQGSPLRELETSLKKVPLFRQKFQVPKMEGFLNLSSRLFWGWEKLPYISRIHTASIGEDSSILGAWNVWWSFKKFHFTNLKTKKFEHLHQSICFLHFWGVFLFVGNRIFWCQRII